MDQFLKIALQAVQEAGDLIGGNFQNLQDSDIQAKGKNDFVTRVDREAEAVISRILLKEFPRHQILGEESGYSRRKSKYLWVIDPLDGTTNFIQGIPHFAISMALMANGKVIFGLIYNPLSEERFHAIKGQGAFLNNRPICGQQEKNTALSLRSDRIPFQGTPISGSIYKHFPQPAFPMPGYAPLRVSRARSGLHGLRPLRFFLGSPFAALGFHGRKIDCRGSRRHNQRFSGPRIAGTNKLGHGCQ